MKQFLFLVLITVIVCTSVEQYDPEDLEIVLQGLNYKTIWNRIKNNVNKAKSWLKSVGLYDPLINCIKQVGGYYAKNYCTSKGIPDSVCSSIFEFLSGLIK